MRHVELAQYRIELDLGQLVTLSVRGRGDRMDDEERQLGKAVSGRTLYSPTTTMPLLLRVHVDGYRASSEGCAVAEPPVGGPICE